MTVRGVLKSLKTYKFALFGACVVPAILNEAVPATTQNVDAEIQETLKLAQQYTGSVLSSSVS
jgi:hypothetical protein